MTDADREACPPDPDTVRRRVLADRAAQARVADELGVAVESVAAVCDEPPITADVDDPRLAAILGHRFQSTGLLDVSGRILLLNEAAVELAGVSARELVGTPYWDGPWWRHDAPQRDWLRAAVRRAADGEVTRRAITQMTADGALVDIDFSLSPVRAADGRVIYLVSEGHDITEHRRTTRTLERERRQLQALLDASEGGLLLLDRGGRVLAANHRAAAHVGIAVGDLIGRDVFEFAPEDLAALRRRRFEAVLRSASRTRFVEELPDNAAAVTLVPIVGQDGTVDAVAAHVADLTEQLATRRALDEIEYRYAATFEKAAVGIAHVSPEGRWMRVNRRLCDILGHSAESLLGALFADISHPDDIVEDHRLLQTLIDDEQHMVRAEKRCVHAEGHPVWVELTACLVRRADGSPDFFITVINDITARRMAESRLLFTQHSIDHSAVPVLWLTEGMQVSYANAAACAALGWQQGADGESPAVALQVAGGAWRDWRSLIGELREDGFAVRELELQRGDGTVFPARVSASYLEYADEQYAFLSFYDLSESRQLENALRRAQKLESIGTLAGGIAHDFNNILVAIMGYGQLAAEDIAEPRLALRHLEEIQRATLRAKELVRQILTFSRRSEGSRQPLNVSMVVKECVKLLRSTVPASIEIRCTMRDAPLVNADPTQVHQVLMNLGTNAFHAMEESGGTLEVELDEVDLTVRCATTTGVLEPGHYMRLVVRDSGPGLPVELYGKVFEPYFTTKDVGKGTGLGLAIVHGIVHDHGGGILIGDGAFGRGVEFTVYLPALRLEAGLLEQASHLPQTHLAGEESVLVVDDEEAIATLSARALVRHGYRVRAHTSSAEALAEFTAAPTRFDLLVTDLTMPGMSGVELAAQVLALRPDLPILLCTGYPERVDAAGSRRRGFRALLSKPFGPRELVAAVRSVLDGGWA